MRAEASSVLLQDPRRQDWPAAWMAAMPWELHWQPVSVTAHPEREMAGARQSFCERRFISRSSEEEVVVFGMD